MADTTTVDEGLVAADNVFGFEPSSVKRLPFTELLKRMGPGFILAGIQLSHD